MPLTGIIKNLRSFLLIQNTLSNITPFDRTTINDYMRDIFLPKNIVKIQSYSYSKFPTVYELTKYGFNLNNSVEIFVIKLNR